MMWVCKACGAAESDPWVTKSPGLCARCMRLYERGVSFAELQKEARDRIGSQSPAPKSGGSDD